MLLLLLLPFRACALALDKMLDAVCALIETAMAAVSA